MSRRRDERVPKVEGAGDLPLEAEAGSAQLVREQSVTLDLRNGTLHAGAQEVDLRPKALAVLTYLIRNAGQSSPKASSWTRSGQTSL